MVRQSGVCILLIHKLGWERGVTTQFIKARVLFSLSKCIGKAKETEWTYRQMLGK